MSTVVMTRFGRVRGAEVPGGVVFRGIPYAASTAGERRFRAPAPPAAWSGVREATVPGATAPQIVGLMRDLPEQSEDCLHVNVWTPRLDRARRPVLVFVHGGAFTTGASTNAMYDAAPLACRGDLVVVSMNYRLGVLGFAYLGALAELESEQNNGLRDVLCALRWVRDNVDGFGGDPENVTLMGQSAGAMITADLLSLPASRGLFRRAIAQSGATHHVVGVEQAARVTEAWLDELGVGAGQGARLRRLPFEQLVAAQAVCARRYVQAGPPGRPFASPGMTLLPVVDGDLITGFPFEAAAHSEVPLLLGSNRDEWNFWIFLADASRLELDWEGLSAVIEKRVPGHGQRLIEAYRQACESRVAPGRLRPWQVFSAIESDRQFRIPAIRLAERRSAPSYLYGFAWDSPLFDGALGACHALEVPFVLGQVAGQFGRVFVGPDPAALRLSEAMMDHWIAFARGGDPSTARGSRWPRYESRQRLTMQLSLEAGVQSAPEDGLRALWDEAL